MIHTSCWNKARSTGMGECQATGWFSPYKLQAWTSLPLPNAQPVIHSWASKELFYPGKALVGSPPAFSFVPSRMGVLQKSSLQTRAGQQPSGHRNLQLEGGQKEHGVQPGAKELLLSDPFHLYHHRSHDGLGRAGLLGISWSNFLTNYYNNVCY